MKANDPINPCINHNEFKETGIDLRTHLAAMAMQGILSNSHDRNVSTPYAYLIEESVKCADLLILELNKTV